MQINLKSQENISQFYRALPLNSCESVLDIGFLRAFLLYSVMHADRTWNDEALRFFKKDYNNLLPIIFENRYLSIIWVMAIFFSSKVWYQRHIFLTVIYRFPIFLYNGLAVCVFFWLSLSLVSTFTALRICFSNVWKN